MQDKQDKQDKEKLLKEGMAEKGREQAKEAGVETGKSSSPQGHDDPKKEVSEGMSKSGGKQD